MRDKAVVGGRKEVVYGIAVSRSEVMGNGKLRCGRTATTLSRLLHRCRCQTLTKFTMFLVYTPKDENIR